jgi:putative transposase
MDEITSTLKDRMMTTARRNLINVEITSYYHCMTHCIRNAFLAGFNDVTGIDYEKRRQWIEDKMFSLAQIFSIDVCAYAIMSNHYHLVLHVDKQIALKWSLDEIFQNWQKLHKLDNLALRYLHGEALAAVDMLQLGLLAGEYRERLMSISWFMRELNEYTARRANAEDNCKGKFWEPRFKSQALMDESAILSCMAYVDLNPIRAGMCSTPEESDFTAIQTRIQKILGKANPDKKLMPLNCLEDQSQAHKLMIEEKDYLSLVDWTGRIIRADKVGAVPQDISPILSRLGLEKDDWFVQARYFNCRFKCVAGFWQSIQGAAKQFKKKWFQGKPSKNLKIS